MRIDLTALSSLDGFGRRGQEVPSNGEREEAMKVANDEMRFSAPLYTVAEAARFLGVPTSTLSTWAKGYVRRPHT